MSTVFALLGTVAAQLGLAPEWDWNREAAELEVLALPPDVHSREARAIPCLPMTRRG